MSWSDETVSREEQLERQIQQIIAKIMTGSATSAERSLLQDLQDQKSRRMRSSVFDRLERMRRERIAR